MIGRGRRAQAYWRLDTPQCLAHLERRTIIGAEANLAARLQSIADAGQIVISYETYAFVRDTIVARALAPISMKGISREVIPYVVSGVLDATGKNVQVFSEHMTGMDFYFNASMIDSTKAPHIREIL